MKQMLIYFNFVTNLLLLSVLVIGGIAWADTNGVWTNAEDVRAGTLASDEGGGDFTFPDNVNVNGQASINGQASVGGNMDVGGNLEVANTVRAQQSCIDGECHTSWNSICESWLDDNAINN